MNGKETKEALSEIALKKADMYNEKIALLEKDKKIERKALTISRQIAQNCAGFVNIEFENRFYEVREMRVYGQAFHDFDEWKPVYESLSGDDRESFLVFSFAIIMVRHCLLDKRTDETDRLDGKADVQKVFEAKIIISVIDEILREWQSFWNKNGCVPCEVIK